MPRLRDVEKAANLDSFEPYTKATRAKVPAKKTALAKADMALEASERAVERLSRMNLALSNLLKRALHWAPQSFRDEVERVKRETNLEDVHP